LDGAGLGFEAATFFGLDGAGLGFEAATFFGLGDDLSFF